MGSPRGHVYSPWNGPGRRVGRRWTAQATPSLLRLTDLGWGLKEPWELGVRALSACGVMDLGPQTADPDARSPSTSGGAATMCWSWWSRPRLQAGECAHRLESQPCRGRGCQPRL